MSVFVYLIQSKKDGGFYTGISKDVNSRLSKHNNGGVKSTRNQGPWKLCYQKEYDNYAKARKHEKWLKKKSREYKLQLAQS